MKRLFFSLVLICIVCISGAAFAQDIAGRYERTHGVVLIQPEGAGRYKVSIQTRAADERWICDIEAIGAVLGKDLVIAFGGDGEETTTTVPLRLSGNTIIISHDAPDGGYCGMNGFYGGTYVKKAGFKERVGR